MSSIGYVKNDSSYNKGKIKELPCVYPETIIDYRPMTSLEFAQHGDKVERLNEEQTTRMIAIRITKHVRSWNVKDGAGEEVPLMEEAILKLNRLRFMKIWKIVAGTDGPDEILNQTGAENTSDIEALLEAERTGRRPGEAKQEQDTKN